VTGYEPGKPGGKGIFVRIGVQKWEFMTKQYAIDKHLGGNNFHIPLNSMHFIALCQSFA
jgi:hypothetical protein